MHACAATGGSMSGQGQRCSGHGSDVQGALLAYSSSPQLPRSTKHRPVSSSCPIPVTATTFQRDIRGDGPRAYVGVQGNPCYPTRTLHLISPLYLTPALLPSPDPNRGLHRSHCSRALNPSLLTPTYHVQVGLFTYSSPGVMFIFFLLYLGRSLNPNPNPSPSPSPNPGPNPNPSPNPSHNLNPSP